MSTNVTNDDVRGARETLDAAEIPFPRYCIFRGIQIRIQGPEQEPEFLNDQDEWQTLETHYP